VARAPAPVSRHAARVRPQALAEQIYAAHRARLLAIARRNSASAEEAEEALQDALVLFIERFDPEGDSPPLAWLTLTLKRRCWALYRLQQQSWERRSSRDCDRCSDIKLLGGPNRDPDDLLDRGEEIAAIRDRLATLKRDERRALSLLAFGYSYREICKQTGWSYTKVNRCLAEGRAALRELGASTSRDAPD
jgi:RNA polymerase sigma factor (sigma-70 family)